MNVELRCGVGENIDELNSSLKNIKSGPSVSNKPMGGSKYYLSLIEAGKKKSDLSVLILLLKSFAAGLWVAVYGHACLEISGALFDEHHMVSLSKLIYAVFFTGAFVAIIYTESELFTGNTAVMIFYSCHNWKKQGPVYCLKSLGRVWAVSLFGNAIGSIMGAFMISYASGTFDSSTVLPYLTYVGGGKTKERFLREFLLGIVCNMLVCLATLCTTVIQDGAGKILSIFFTISVFAAAGFEHIIANFYTLSTALMYGCTSVSVKGVIVYNWIPVLLGNIVGGGFFCGYIWYLTAVRPLKPQQPLLQEYHSMTNHNSRVLSEVSCP